VQAETSHWLHETFISKLFVIIFAGDNGTGKPGDIAHAPTNSLGQKWQRTQIGKEKVSCSQWGEEAARMQGVQVLFFFWGCRNFVVLNVFALSFQCVPNMFPINPHFIPYPLP
jgi:hypothetical protein